MTAQDQQSRAAFEDGKWYWVAHDGWGQKSPIIAPARYRADCDSWYSFEFSGIATRFLKVLEQCERQAARALPAGMEPVAWMHSYTSYPDSPEDAPGYEVTQIHQNPKAPEETKQVALYTAAQVQAMLAQGLAPGWQAVPTMPTQDMIAVGWNYTTLSGGTYLAMLAAAPRPPAAQGDMGIPIAAAQNLVVGPCGQCKDDRQPCSCAIDTMLKARGQIAVNRERYLSQAKLAKAAQERKPLTPERIHQIDDETHFHEAPDWPVRFGRALEAAHDIK